MQLDQDMCERVLRRIFLNFLLQVGLKVFEIVVLLSVAIGSTGIEDNLICGQGSIDGFSS